MALVLNGSGSITGVTDLATAGVALEDAALTDPVVTGGVYLGGTGSANYLDDYEEGTFTPTYVPTSGSFGSITYDGDPNGVVGKYTKIGNMVAVYIRIRTDAVTIGTASGYLQMGGLPFTTDSQYQGAVALGYAAAWGTTPHGVYVQTSSDKFYISHRSVADGNDSLTSPSDMALGANSNQIMVSLVYRTNL
jgi:hypothetical protein